MEEMMAAQRALGSAILDEGLGDVAEPAQAIRESLASGRVVTVCGCGTSEHGALGVVALLRAALPPDQRGLVQARPAFAVARDAWPGVCLGVSHDGGTRATGLALAAARSAGAWTAVITARPEGSIAAGADAVITTPVPDRSWCHTIAYTSALLVGAAIARSFGLSVDGEGARRVIEGGLALAGLAPIASALAPGRVVLCTGAGVDQVTARELALKIALETVLHGQLAGHDAGDRLILVSAESPDDRGRLLRRSEHVLRAAEAIGIPVAAVLSAPNSAALSDELTPAGRAVLPDLDGEFDATLGALLGGAAAAQALTLALVGARGTNPDLIRREERPYRTAALVAEGASDW
jgi:phosphoheptose isomerase